MDCIAFLKPNFKSKVQKYEKINGRETTLYAAQKFLLESH